MNFEEFCNYLRTSFYTEENIPKTVTEYMNNYPKGYSRTTLKDKYGVTVGKLLESINPTYIILNDPNRAYHKLIDKCRCLNISLLSEYTGCKNKLLFKCNTCCNEWYTSATSIQLSKYGCPQCAGNKQLNTNELLQRAGAAAEANNCSLVTEALTGALSNTNPKVLISCNACKTIFTRGIRQLLYRQQCVCEVCFPSKAYNVNYNGITFSSNFEVECYKIILGYYPDVKVHVPYKNIVSTTRRFNADFIIGNLVLEVTSYVENSEYFSDHLVSLEEKKKLLSTSQYTFKVVRSLPELREVLSNKI